MIVVVDRLTTRQATSVDKQKPQAAGFLMQQTALEYHSSNSVYQSAKVCSSHARAPAGGLNNGARVWLERRLECLKLARWNLQTVECDVVHDGPLAGAPPGHSTPSLLTSF
ncbi:hypothetical protein J6590_097786 [Homalodisca vitripennis]|nr:hypothetical protein J6590_097786 [Homalodisca vitripennis]